MRKATSSDGEYFASSMAFTVCRVTPIRSARSACVISAWSKRRRRMSLRMGTSAMSRILPEVHDLTGIARDFRQHDGEEEPVGRVEGRRAERDGRADGRCTDHLHVEGDARGLESDLALALVS